jgi:delta8-fatty-acid desaturase
MAGTHNTGTVPLQSRRSRKETTLSRRYIEGLIAEGKHVLIFEDRVLKVDAWIPYHPGGDKSIKHMVGRDATDEINAYVATKPTNSGGSFANN